MRRVIILGALLACAISFEAPGVKAATAKASIVQQVHDPEICWEPDIEFPVPCDDDDD